MPEQGALSLLDHPVAKELLHSTHLAKLAYVSRTGEPRVVPIWFHWDGQEVVMGGWPTAPKVKALSPSAKVAVTIASETEPYHVLMIRGTATTEIVDGVPPEYAAAASRYMGEEHGAEWVASVGQMFPRMSRIAVRPAWVGVIDFETRFPTGLERAMAAAGASAG